MKKQTKTIKCGFTPTGALTPMADGTVDIPVEITTDSQGVPVATIQLGGNIMASVTMSATKGRVISTTLLGCDDNDVNNESIDNIASCL